MIIKTALNPNAGNLFLHLTNRRDGNEDIRIAGVLPARWHEIAERPW
jgi:hypothetical protein